MCSFSTVAVHRIARNYASLLQPFQGCRVNSYVTPGSPPMADNPGLIAAIPAGLCALPCGSRLNVVLPGVVASGAAHTDTSREGVFGLGSEWRGSVRATRLE